MAKNAAPTSNNLTAEVRTRTGKGASRLARREGRVPVVLYGHGTEPQHLEINAREYAAVLRNSGTNAVLTLDIAGKEQLALTKQVVVHPIKRNIQHADLIVVKRGEKVTVDVSIVVEGDAQSGTLVAQDTNTIQIEADVQSIPESLTVSVEGIEAGTQILAGQVELPAGVTLVTDPEVLVINVVAAPTAEDLEAEGAGEEAGSGEAAAGGEAAEEAAAESE
ncbi:50S ribosomal protein L25/general stress protein Ctc [Mycolicibacterium mucogenicum]|uniref:Large ribosomal subunit protein bL25 n=2 Tax=Mycolicibacterium mucogenicum TaxID=56689 RepID=A0A3G9H5B4_MYCMU|nr:50S ribosomal protein L25/general stress protein Ctc [Mycolicibacterium mucogenicum]KAB7761488.1 50S ribosomal protein L25 [Mycolicibacterium mucogenicum DSM 44124]QPG70313.1 50S ribosomal protein L25/general stress protein Ctc [Mycolicibacterium mucogenicum DSM 44124]BBF95864.1 50S ribosomal protein L25 [Mycolicibacterium mucogenicum]